MIIASPALALAPAAVLAAPPAYAGGLQAAFGNTIVSTYPDGRTAKLWLNADGSYDGLSRHRTRSGGRWSVKGERLCLKQSRPFFYPFAWCSPLVSGGVGTTWSGKAPTGEAIRLTLVPGR